MKKIKKYNRGFTLVEMITTVTILGVVSLIALPVISNVSAGFTTQKFENYSSALLTAGKLYADQSMEDLFGDADDGCVDVSFSEIINKNLIQDIDLKDASCASPSTYVRITRKNSVNEFDVSLECALNGAIAYQHLLEENDSCLPLGNFEDSLPGSINFPDNLTPYPRPPSHFIATPSTIYSEPNEVSEPEKKKDVKILVSNQRGFAPNIKIRYYWINADTNEVIGEKKEKDFKNALVKISTTFVEETTTPNVSANLKLIVEPIYVVNGDGLQISNKYESGIFKIDNTAPTIVIKANAYENNKVGALIKQSNNADLSITEWKKHGYYFDYSGSSDNYGITKQVWKWNKTGSAKLDKTLTGGPTQDNAVTNKTFTGVGARYGTVTMCDHAGNCNSKNVQVNISTVFKVKYDANGGTGTTATTTCYYGFDCSLADPGFTRNNYDFVGWTINGTDYSKNGSIKNLSDSDGKELTAKAKWKLKTYTVTLKGNGIDDQGTKEKTHGTDLTLPTPTRSGYTFKGWNTDANSHDSGYGTKYTEDKAITLYAIWKKDSAYTIHYKMDKGTWSGDFNDSESCYVWNKETSCSITVDNIPRPSGWSDTDNGGASTANGRSYNYEYKNLFTYVGWNRNSGQWGADYNQGSSISLSSSIDLYAVILLDRDGKKFRVSNTSDDANHSGLTMKNAVGGSMVYVMHDGAKFIASSRMGWGYLDGNVWIHGHMANEGCTINTLDWPHYGQSNPWGGTWRYTLLNGRGWYGSCACYLGYSSNWNNSGSGDCYSNDNWSNAKYLYPV